MTRQQLRFESQKEAPSQSRERGIINRMRTFFLRGHTVSETSAEEPVLKKEGEQRSHTPKRKAEEARKFFVNKTSVSAKTVNHASGCSTQPQREAMFLEQQEMF